MRHLALLTAAVALGIHLVAGTAHAEGDIEAGEALAGRWCASCHLTGPAQTTAPNDLAPPFVTLARAGWGDTRRLSTFLADPHPPMRGVDPDRMQTEDLAAYLANLAIAAAPPH